MEVTLPQIAEGYYRIFTDVYVHGFAAVIILDIITGVVKGFVTKSLNSTIGRRGLMEHLLVLVLGITLYPYLNFIGFDEVARTFLIFFVATYGISVAENLADMGVPLPKFLKKRLEKIRDSIDEAEDEEINKKGVKTDEKDN
mgnify:CR=1 FL=1